MNRKIISRFESDKEKIEIISRFESDEEKNGMGNSSAGKLAHKKMWASEECEIRGPRWPSCAKKLSQSHTTRR